MATEISIQASGAVAFQGNGASAFASSAGGAARNVEPAAAPLSADDGGKLTLAEAVRELEQRAAVQGAELNFRVDEDSGRVVVSVIDQANGTVLRQIPSEEALRIARALANYEPRLIDAQA